MAICRRSVLVVVLCIIALSIVGCALWRALPRASSEQPPENKKSVSVKVNWNEVSTKAIYNKSPIVGKFVKVDEFKLSKVYPVSEKGNAWNSKYVKLLFTGCGAADAKITKILLESVVELKVVPSQNLKFAVASIHSTNISLFDDEGQLVKAAVDDVKELFEKKVQSLNFDFPNYPGVTANECTDEIVLCHNTNIEFSVRDNEKK